MMKRKESPAEELMDSVPKNLAVQKSKEMLLEQNTFRKSLVRAKLLMRANQMIRILSLFETYGPRISMHSVLKDLMLPKIYFMLSSLYSLLIASYYPD